MKISKKWFGIYLGSISLISSNDQYAGWGFYSHRLINEMAVYTLPPELQVIFKPEIGYISEHAVDADKRRYAVYSEGFHHYIDLDQYGDAPFPGLPRSWDSAVVKFSHIQWILSPGDTVLLNSEDPNYSEEYDSFIRVHFFPKVYAGDFLIHCDTFMRHFGISDSLTCQKVVVIDSLSLGGDLPYHLARTQERLTAAFQKRDIEKIIRISTDLGHYIADAHVPLHTTRNYDGQLTGQQGIHAFWESRIPEMFALRDYDFFVGKAGYIHDIPGFFWDLIIKSHLLVPEVLSAEIRARQSVPAAFRYCFEDRRGQTIRAPCLGFTRAFNRELGDMVEAQMRKSVRAIGDCWYSAWVDAGQPDFSDVKPTPEKVILTEEFQPRGDSTIKRRSSIRTHE